MRIMFSFVRFLTTLDKTISWQSVQYNEYDTKANLARESATQLYFYSLWINKKAMKEKNKDRNSISMRILKSFAAEYDFKFIVVVSSWESNGNQTFRMERQLASAAASHVAITSAKKRWFNMMYPLWNPRFSQSSHRRMRHHPRPAFRELRSHEASEVLITVPRGRENGLSWSVPTLGGSGTSMCFRPILQYLNIGRFFG